MKMNIDQLLEKYWNAEASLQEEAELRAYFSGNDIAPEHEQFKDLFSFFSISRLQSTNLDVEEVLSSLSDVDALLEKYWNAETSLEEEAQLRDYFSSDHVTPEHKEFSGLFTYYEVIRSQKSDLNVDKIIYNSSSIDALLEKYWNAEASLKEEQELRVYFSGDHVAKEHETYRGMFDLFTAKAKETTDLDIEEILLKAEDDLGNKAIGSTTMSGAAKTKVFQLQKWAMGLAAIFVLAFAAVSVMDQSSQETQYKGQATVLDDEAEAQEAYEITKQALAFLSTKMNKGNEAIVKSVSKAEKVKIFK
ncbi:MAG: hypothetical protein AAGA77_04940 [Bacteroidota bacterium]